VGSRATLRDGTSLTLIDDLDEIEKALLPVVAAQPGYTLLTYYVEWAEDGGRGIDRMPVVAWRIDGVTALPVTPDSEEEKSSNCIGSGVLMPDGRVVRHTSRRSPTRRLGADQWRSWPRLAASPN
jgi:hypothetical protein